MPHLPKIYLYFLICLFSKDYCNFSPEILFYCEERRTQRKFPKIMTMTDVKKK
ncbi:hypothetical protein DOY81_002003, partial [Sarcophaga bullata]